MFTLREGRGMLVLFALTLALPLQCLAQSVSNTAVNKAHDFLKTERTGKEINNLMHFGTQYSGHEYVKTMNVTDSSGSVIPGEFALVYRFWWDTKYSTDLAVFCTPSGSVTGVRSLRSDGVGQTPFLAAQATIAVVGSVIYEACKDSMTEKDRQIMRRCIDQADVKTLLELQLQVRQAVGR
jgi:hypothetical protein